MPGASLRLQRCRGFRSKLDGIRGVRGAEIGRWRESALPLRRLLRPPAIHIGNRLVALPVQLAQSSKTLRLGRIQASTRVSSLGCEQPSRRRSPPGCSVAVKPHAEIGPSLRRPGEALTFPFDPFPCQKPPRQRTTLERWNPIGETGFLPAQGPPRTKLLRPHRSLLAAH